MATLLIDLTDIAVSAEWARVEIDTYTAIAIPDSDNANADSGWTVAYVELESPGARFNKGHFPTSGDAAWVVNDASVYGHFAHSLTDWMTLSITGPANTDFTTECFSSYDLAGRSTQWRVNAETPLDLSASSNTSNVVTFTSTTDGSGNATIQYRQSSGSGITSANAIRIVTAAAAAVTTTDTLQPGESFTLTATNFASAPVSPVTLTDSEGSTITVAVTISGSGPYTAVGTMPTIAEAVTAGTSLLFGDVTIELTT